MRLPAAATILLALALPALAQPRIVYSKDFPGSVPPFALITVERDGKAVYKESPTDDQPIAFQLKQEEADQIFDLADKLDHFRKPLETQTKVKVANMGMKTFRWEDGQSKPIEVKFNFTLDPDGAALADWFDRMIVSEMHFIALDRTVHFDKLGAYQAVLLLQAAIERGRIVDPEQYLPLLDRIAKNSSFLNAARERAAGIANWIRNPSQPLTPETDVADPSPAPKPKGGE